jgi:hypothetical protein
MDETDGCLVYLLTLACIVMVLFALALFISWDRTGRDGIEIGVEVKGGKWPKEKKHTHNNQDFHVRLAALRAVGV